jgi:type II restriction enzyme
LLESYVILSECNLVQLELYRRGLGITSLEELEKTFRKTLLATNRTPAFFVDWDKVQENIIDLDAEISLLNQAIGTSDLEEQLALIIAKYPEVLRLFPRIIAYREMQFPVLSSKFLAVQNLDFERTSLTPPSAVEIEKYMQFAKDAGIVEILDYIDNLHDFLLGVEVGMDTNARKNRSGQAMESLLEPMIRKICEDLGCQMKTQESFKSVPSGIKVPDGLKERKADFIVYSGKRATNIEVNFYSAAGSKPEEIVESYINRHNELKSSGWHFIWITDGDRWSSCENQLQKAFREMDCVLNIELVRAGVLEEALKHFLELCS